MEGWHGACVLCYRVTQEESLQLSFQTKALRTICESEEEAELKFGKRVAEALKRRLADLEAATSIKDLLVGQPRPQDGAGRNMVIELADGFLLVVTANHTNNPQTSENKVDWSRVVRIKISGIEEDHG
jgi:toxin HigB-1